MVCDAIAKREGFLHTERHRFSDPETSGGTPRRAGYSAMLAAAMRGEFDVLVAEDISRLWRNMEMQTRDINELLELRISIVTQAEDTRRKNDLMMLNLKGAMNENNRKEIGRRVRNKMELLAKSGRPAGGRAYGYIPASQSGTGQIEIHEQQAQIVRQIFEWRAAGWSGKRIAQELNVRQVPAPGAAWKRNQDVRSQKRTDGEWVRSAIIGDIRRGTGILNNPVYKSEVVWGRSRWIRSPRDSTIRRCEVVDDADELVIQRIDRLRIVSDELWNAVHIIQSARTPRSEAIRAAKRRQGRGPALWLSSLLVCSECGSNYVQYGRTDYVCGGFHNGSTCSNGTRFRIGDIEREVLAALALDFPQSRRASARHGPCNGVLRQSAEHRGQGRSRRLSRARRDRQARDGRSRAVQSGKAPGTGLQELECRIRERARSAQSSRRAEGAARFPLRIPPSLSLSRRAQAQNLHEPRKRCTLARSAAHRVS